MLSVKLVQLARVACDSAACPTIFATDRDTVVVQGYQVAPVDAGVDVPTGEFLVEIPRALLLDSSARLGISG